MKRDLTHPTIPRVERPTLVNWMEAPGSHWAFRHVRELIPSARIAARAPSPLHPAPVAGLLDLSWTGPDGEDRQLTRFLENSYADSLIVLHRGRIVLEWYAPDVLPDDRHINFSVSKSITGLLAGALAGAGKLDLDGNVIDYVPEVERSGFSDASLRHLLDMSANIGFVEDYSLGEDIMLRYRQAAGWMPVTSEEGLHGFLSSVPRGDGPHGERFHYLSPTTDMLGWVCERASGLTYAQALSAYVWTPMGAEADAEVTVDRNGTPRAAGGISSTAADLARVGQLVLDGGREVLPEWFVDDLFHGGDPALWAAGEYAASMPGAAYRSCWYELLPEGEVLMAGGIHGQLIWIDRARQVVVAKQSCWPVPVDDAFTDAVHNACSAIAGALSS